jgi:hypothetical protein
MGSNSSRDLYILTGWLPEKIKIIDNKSTADANAIWAKIYNGNKNNDCLVTLSTGTILDEDAIGLVGTHAYGVFEIYEYQGTRMMLVKNPWGHFRWNGKYSNGDSAWTPDLKRALGYDNFKDDKGVFWMDFDSVL